MIVAGFGFRAGAGLASLWAALELARQGKPAVTHLATAEDKVAALSLLAEALGVPVLGVPSQKLSGMVTLTRSTASVAARFTGSLAEASALGAAGADARLLGPRHVSPDRMATCAIAEGSLP